MNLDFWFETITVVDEKSNITEGVWVQYRWNNLPMELLLKIVSLVDDRAIIAASDVCTGWRDAICNGITHLSLSWCKDNMNKLVLSIAPKFTKLRSLTLSNNNTQLEDDAIECIANYCHELTELDLSGSHKLTDWSLFVLTSGCPNLTMLDISGCLAFTEVGLRCLSRCKHLKWLNLCGCVRATTDTALDMISGGCPELQSLDLGRCVSVTDIGIICLTCGCQDLRELNLHGCVGVTDKCVTTLSPKLPQLRVSGLKCCQNITTDDVPTCDKQSIMLTSATPSSWFIHR